MYANYCIHRKSELANCSKFSDNQIFKLFEDMMETRLPLYKKLLVMYRIEPGCLGPQGADYVEEFCVFAKKKLKDNHGHCLRWTIKPRYDKTMPELEFQIKNAVLSRDNAAKYMDSFGIDIDAFEEELEESLADLVDAFFER